MTSAAWTIALVLLPGIAASAEPVPLDEEFLEYLANVEDQADDWTWFDADEDSTEKSERSEQHQPPSPQKATEVER